MAAGTQAAKTEELAKNALAQATYTKRLAVQAERSTSIANNALELSERPWVSADFSVAGPLIFDENGGHVTIRVLLKNTGHSPAVRGSYDFKLSPLFLEEPNPVRQREEMCKNVTGESALSANREFSQTWFPEENTPVYVTLTMNQAEIDAAMVDLPRTMFPSHPPKVSWVSLSLIACIAYRSSFSDATYHTAFPPSELRLYLHFTTGIEAN